MKTIVDFEPIDKLVVQSNHLVNSKFNLSRDEFRIFVYLLLKIKKGDKEFVEVKVPCHVLHDGKVKVNYKEIKDASDRLTSQKIGIETIDHKGKRKFDFIPLMAYCSYKEGSGYIIAQFNARMKVHLLDLSEMFTAAQYRLFMRIQTFYSYRIYWMLKQYEDFKGKTFLLDDLKVRLAVDDKYKRYGDFKRRILNVAKKDLKKSDMGFEYQEIKSGRKVEKIKFVILGNQPVKENSLPTFAPQDSQGVLDFSSPQNVAVDNRIRSLMKMGFKSKEAEQIIDLVEDKVLLKKVLYKYETDFMDASNLNNEKIRHEFLDLFGITTKN